MKTITEGRLIALCSDKSREQIKEAVEKRRGHFWSAPDILAIDGVPDIYKLDLVLNEKLISAPTLHEFACRCAENTFALAHDVNPHCVIGISAKRAWLRGIITEADLRDARQEVDMAYESVVIALRLAYNMARADGVDPACASKKTFETIEVATVVWAAAYFASDLSPNNAANGAAAAEAAAEAYFKDDEKEPAEAPKTSQAAVRAAWEIAWPWTSLATAKRISAWEKTRNRQLKMITEMLEKECRS